MPHLPAPLYTALNIDENATVVRLAGYENSNYLVQDKGSFYVVKQLLTHSADSTESEGLYRNRLAAAGLPVVPYTKLTDTHYVLERGTDRYVALPYVPGQPAGYTEQLAADVGAMLAAIHQVSSVELPERHTWFSENYIPESLRLIDDTYGTDKRAMAAYWERTPGFWHSDLPEGVVHGDLHNENVVVDASNKIASIIDWEETTIGPLLLDLAYTVRSICFQKGICNRPLFDAFMYAYQERRPLTAPEKQLFAPALQYTALILSIWAHVKKSQGQMHEALFQGLRQYYTRRYQVPEI